MNKLITFILGAAAGAAAGSLITWKFVEEKYKKLADEEIESVIERFKEREKLGEFVKDADRVVYAHKDVSNSINIPKEYSDVVEDLGYSNENEEDESKYEIYVAPGEDTVAPYVINPDEYGEVYDYKKKSWTYYADNIITDETGEIVVDLENTIGDALDHFGEYEDDSVHVRNENLGCDIEILRHEKTFEEINGDDI